MSLILTRRLGESIYINDNIILTLKRINGFQATFAIDAPLEVKIYREEIYNKIKNNLQGDFSQDEWD